MPHNLDLTDFKLTPLDLPICPNIARYFGYPAGLDADLVAFYWYPGDFTFDDGSFAGSANRWFPFRLFLEHPLVSPNLEKYFLGADDSEPKHWLLLDRTTRKFWVGAPNNVSAVLKNQNNLQIPTFPINAAAEDLDMACKELVDLLKADEPATEDIAARMERENTLLSEFQAWLDSLTSTIRTQ